MIAVFKSEEKYRELCRICSVNSLLLHRCEEFYLLLNEKEKLFHKIDNHLKNVKCQLSRLYRIRNEIAHSASIEMYQCNMIKFIEHLDDYLMSFVAEMLNCVFEHKDRVVDLDEALEIIKNNHKDYQDIKKSKDITLLDRSLSDLFEVGEINLIR